MARYERVVFLDSSSEDADELLELLNDEGEDVVIDRLAEHHYSGEHETADELARGSSDDWYEDDDGYILTWNNGLGYIGLEYDTEFDAEPDEPDHENDDRYKG